MRSKRARLLAGVLVSPAVPGLVLFIFGTLIGGAARELFLVFLFGAIIAYPTTLILGMPMFAVLRFLKLNGVGVYLIAGSAMGLAVYLILLGPDSLSAVLSRPLLPSLAAGCGIVAAGTFWAIVRPDGNGTGSA